MFPSLTQYVVAFSGPNKYNLSDGEVTESAEGARLLSECPAINGTQGSNPCLSAIKVVARRQTCGH